MGITDKAKNETEKVVGQGKQALGEATDDQELADEGRADQSEAAVKKAGERVKDTAHEVKETVQNVFKD